MQVAEKENWSKSWTLQLLPQTLLLPSSGCNALLPIGQEITLLLIHCPLSEANHFVVIQP